MLFYNRFSVNIVLYEMKRSNQMSSFKRLITTILIVIMVITVTSCEGPSKETLADQEPITIVPSTEYETAEDEALITETPLTEEEPELEVSEEEAPEEAPEEVPEDKTPKSDKTEKEEIQYTKVDEIKYAKSNANIRKGPSTVYDKLGKLTKGQKLNIIGITDNGWSVIDYDGSEGFVSANYLVDSMEEVTKPGLPLVLDSPEDKEPVDEPTPTEEPTPVEELIEPEEDETPIEDQYAAEVLRLVNIERSKVGISELTADEDLRNAANRRAIEIKKLFAHDRPDGSSCFTVLDEAGISYRATGENIAIGHRSPEEVVEGWMNSQGHKENILEERFRKLGVGIHIGEDGYIGWAQLFTD